MPDNTVRHQYPMTPASVGRARHDCERTLEAWGLSAADPSASDVVLMVSELVTNAITHGRVPHSIGRPVGLVMERDNDTVRVEVTDMQSDKVPELHSAGLSDTGGRGLWMVAELADQWGWRRNFLGKAVWVEKKMGGGEESCPSL
ncbi:ATP-binding protein [Streptomyces sp. NPDC059568]|uniref:ATP-binding protein n=1 Tax=Streptomyces sp. NPDC059568 TaxID=3346868 RepID=UPI00369CA014